MRITEGRRFRVLGLTVPQEHSLHPPVPNRAPVSVDDDWPNSNDNGLAKVGAGITRRRGASLLVRRTVGRLEYTEEDKASRLIAHLSDG